MRCARCQGLMVARACCERGWRDVAPRRPRGPVMWNCLNCGNYLDATIAFNRALAKPETEAQRNARIWRRVQAEVKLMEVAV